MRGIPGGGVLVLAAIWLSGCQGTTTASPTVDRSATLSWQAPTTDTDGTALMDLAGYRIYYGNDASNLTQTIDITSPGVETYVFNNLASGTWYFALKAVTSTGVESALSEIVGKSIG